MPLSRAVFYASTLGGILVAVRSVLKGPPPLWVAVSLSLAYGALLLAGVFVLRLRMFADAVVAGPPGARGITLTFDDGPHPVHTRRVLDTLDAHGKKATFFVIGRKAERHPEVLREIIRRGHEIGVHGFAHDRLFSLRGARRVRRDLERAIHTVEQITGARPALFRPPIGHTNPTIARVAEQLGLVVVGWTVAGYDGLAGADSRRVAARIARALDDGAIVLLHDAAERDDADPAGPRALELVLAEAKDRHLRVVPLRDWLADVVA